MPLKSRSSIFWDITPYSPLKINRRFGGRCRKKPENTGSKKASACYLIPAGFLLGLLFDSEDGGEIILRNVGCFSTDYTASYPRRQKSSQPPLCRVIDDE
jgi:hypothetical protein